MLRNKESKPNTSCDVRRKKYANLLLLLLRKLARLVFMVDVGNNRYFVCSYLCVHDQKDTSAIISPRLIRPIEADVDTLLRSLLVLCSSKVVPMFLSLMLFF